MICLGPFELVVVKTHLSTNFAPRLHLPNPDRQSPKQLLHHRICSARPALHRLLINLSSHYHNYINIAHLTRALQHTESLRAVALSAEVTPLK